MPPSGTKEEILKNAQYELRKIFRPSLVAVNGDSISIYCNEADPLFIAVLEYRRRYVGSQEGEYYWRVVTLTQTAIRKLAESPQQPRWSGDIGVHYPQSRAA